MIVHEDKVRAELGGDTRRRSPHHLTRTELAVLIEWLRGGDASHQDMAERAAKNTHNFSVILQRVREVLCVRGDVELAYLVYERGYVCIEETLIKEEP